MSRKKCPPNENSFGGRLRIFRESSGLKLVEFAKILNISHGSLSEIENNHSNMSSKPLKNLVLKTDINVYWLFTGQGSMDRNIEKPLQISKNKGGGEEPMSDELIKKFDEKLNTAIKDIKLFIYEKLDKVDDNIQRLHKELELQKEMLENEHTEGIKQPKKGQGQPSERLIKEVDISSI